MRTRTLTRVNHFVTVGDDEIEVQDRPAEIMAHLDLLVHRQDDLLVVGYLVDDILDRGDYFEEFNDGEFINLGHRRVGPRIPDEIYKEYVTVREFVDRKRAEHPDRVFLIDYFEHGLCRYSLAHEGPNCPWDTARGCFLYIVPEDAPDPERYARHTMDTYTDWCNGNVFGSAVCVYRRLDDGSFEEDEAGRDTCWGLIGDTYAYSHLKETFGDVVARLGGTGA